MKLVCHMFLNHISCRRMELSRESLSSEHHPKPGPAKVVRFHGNDSNPSSPFNPNRPSNASNEVQGDPRERPLSNLLEAYMPMLL